MSARYSYDRSKQADSRIHESMTYREQLDWLQQNFTGMVGKGVYEYVTVLHKRIFRYDRWSGIPGFQSWDWGSPRGTPGSYSIRVWLKDSPTLPNDIAGNILITLKFDDGVKVEALQGRSPLISKDVGGGRSASSIALLVGEAWEKLLTGSVDYGDFSR